MIKIETPFQQRKKMTRLGEALASSLARQPKLLLSNYDLYKLLWDIYVQGNAKYLRGDHPSGEVFKRTRLLLRQEGIIRHDSNYTSLWRVMSKQDLPADDLVCSVDPHCYISHISALQRYGLTNRRPESLYLTIRTDTERRRLLKEQMRLDYGDTLTTYFDDIEKPKALTHPNRVRGRSIVLESTKFFGKCVQIKGSFARISTIGQTFLDTLEKPDHCGGMAHVLEIWSGYAQSYLEEIISTIDESGKPILKVRAGYILDEWLNISDTRIKEWCSFAQRGSSRVLNAGKPFSSEYSEKWMLSLNV